MPPTIHDTVAREYRIIRQSEARKLIQRETHGLVLHVTGDGYSREPHFHWLADLRRQRRRVWGGLLRFVDLLIAKGYPEKVVQTIPDLLRSYISDQYDEPDPSPSRTAKAA